MKLSSYFSVTDFVFVTGRKNLVQPSGSADFPKKLAVDPVSGPGYVNVKPFSSQVFPCVGGPK